MAIRFQRSLLLLLILCFPFLQACMHNSPVGVTFRVSLEEPVASGEKLYITGNQAGLGNWEPNLVALTKIDDNQWEVTLDFPKDENIAFKFTRGSWDNEATTAEGYVPVDYKYKAVKDTTLVYHISSWKDFNYKVWGQVTGQVDYIRDVDFEGLLPRDVLVWLPPDYIEKKGLRYPVLYVHDAQNAFDPQTSTLKRDWQLDEVADSLIRNGIVEPFIMVGLDCTTNRAHEYNYGKLGKLYSRLIIEKIKPMIDQQYRTIPDRSHTGTLGSSMGGLVSFVLAWEHPEVFGMAACFSPAFQIYSYDYVPYVEKYQGRKKQIDLYIDNGTVGLEDELQSGIDAMMKVLDKKGYPYTWFLDEGAEHNEIAWSKRCWRPLVQFFGLNKPMAD